MRRRILVGVTALTVLAAPAAAEAAKKSYRAELRRTTGGWAHVKANDYGSLGFGYGYAYAQDQLCELAEIVVTVNAQRSRYFGPGDGNLESDFFFQRIKDARTVQRLARRRAPHGPSAAVRATVKGFAAGYNAYLRRTGRADLPDPTCKLRLVNQWAEYARAQSVRDLQRAYRRVQGNPWANTIAADSAGNAYYADESVVPNVDADLQSRCGSDHPIAPVLLSQGVVLLDGSRTRCRWKRDRDALANGIIGPSGLPRATRTDYVENSNDSYWLPSARFRIDGFPRIIGGEQTPRLLRARLALTQAEQRLAGTDGLGPPGFTLATLQQVMFGNRNLSAELARDTTVAACQASGRADLAEACAVLAAWDTRADVGSREDLRAKGIALDVPLGELQAEPRGSERIPIHGCSEGEGCFNIISTERDAQGRYDPFTGASFVMTAAFDSSGVVRGEAILSYSQSENPRSPHYADQTRLFSQKEWLPMRFTEQQIRSDPEYKRTVVTGRR
jgi:acyl-homoserine-lactone acylase